MNTNQKPAISIVLCARNEANNIQVVVDRLIEVREKLSDRDVQIIIVDGMSDDGTWEQLTEAKTLPPYFEVIEQGYPLGFGNGMRFGLTHVKHDVIVTIDADLNFDQRDIPKLLSYLTDDVDVVISNPWDPSVFQHDFPWYRAFFSQALTFLYRIALFPLAQDLRSFTAIFRVFRRKVLNDCMPHAGGFLFSAEFISRCILRRYRIKQVNIPCYLRGGGRTKVPFLRTILIHLVHLCKLRLRIV